MMFWKFQLSFLCPSLELEYARWICYEYLTGVCWWVVRRLVAFQSKWHERKAILIEAVHVTGWRRFSAGVIEEVSSANDC